MTFLSTLKRSALAIGTFAALGFTAACDGDGGFAVTPGDYEGAGVYVIDDLDGGRGYMYITVTVNDDGSIEGSGEVYQPSYSPVSVPDGHDPLVLTGTATGDGFTIDLEDGITGEGTVSADGTLTATFSGTTDEGDISGYLGLVPAFDSETGIACGEFGFSDGDVGTDGFEAILASEDGDLFGVFAGSDDYYGIMTGTFDTGINPCEETSCGEIDATLDGTLGATDVSIDTSGAYISWQNDLTYAEVWTEGGLDDGADFNGGFHADVYYCQNGNYD